MVMAAIVWVIEIDWDGIGSERATFERLSPVCHGALALKRSESAAALLTAVVSRARVVSEHTFLDLVKAGSVRVIGHEEKRVVRRTRAAGNSLPYYASIEGI